MPHYYNYREGVRRNEIFEVGQVVYTCQDSSQRSAKCKTILLMEVSEDFWFGKDIDGGYGVTWHPDKLSPIIPIIDT